MVPLSARAVVFALFAGALRLGAQASPYVPLDDIAYSYVDAIMARGEFRQLSALERPYTVGSLLAAIDTARGRGATSRMNDYLSALETVIGKYSLRPRNTRYLTTDPANVLLAGHVVTIREACRAPADSGRLERRYCAHVDSAAMGECERESSTQRSEHCGHSEHHSVGRWPAALPFRTRGTFNLYATQQTSARRELMLARDANSFNPGMTIRVMMAGGPIAASIRPIIDTRFNEDIEFSGRRDRRVNGRTEDGYVSGQWKYGELFLGRVGRNWGPPALYGLQLGNYAYTYDQLYGRIGTDKAHFATVVARLEDITDAAGARTQRYFSIHRLAVRHAAWEIAATESYLYSGAGRGFEPSLVNPLNIYALSWRNESVDGNLGLGLEGSFRSRMGSLAAHVFIDDLQIDRCDPDCEEPSSYGVTMTAEGLPLAGDQRWFASYARVSYLAYRTPNPNERYSSFNIGLGQGFSDFDEVRVGLDLAVVPRTPLRLYLASRRQGEGDYRAPYPAPADYATTPTIFGGIVSRITRLGLTGASRFHDFELSGDVGLNRVSNSAEQRGISANGFQGRVKLSWEPRVSVSF